MFKLRLADIEEHRPQYAGCDVLSIALHKIGELRVEEDAHRADIRSGECAAPIDVGRELNAAEAAVRRRNAIETDATKRRAFTSVQRQFSFASNYYYSDKGTKVIGHSFFLKNEL